MAVGPQDYIDQMLAKKYSDKSVNNIEKDVDRLSMSTDRYWEIQKDIAEVQRALVMASSRFNVHPKIKNTASCA